MCLIARASVNQGLAISSSKGWHRGVRVCACLMCILLQYLLQSCSRGGRGIVEDMCESLKDDEPPARAAAKPARFVFAVRAGCWKKNLFFFVFPRRSICQHGSGSGRVRCKNGTCVTSGYAVQAFIVRASFAFVRAQARMQMKCAMSSRGSTHPCCTCRPRAVRGMSIGKNQWPRDWIKRQDRWKDMDRLPTLALAFLLSCARALLRARSRARSNVSGDTAKRNGCGGRWDGLRHCGRYPKP